MAPNLSDTVESFAEKTLEPPSASGSDGGSVRVSASVLLHLKLTRLGLCPAPGGPARPVGKAVAKRAG